MYIHIYNIYIYIYISVLCISICIINIYGQMDRLINKISIKTNVTTEKGNGRNEI